MYQVNSLSLVIIFALLQDVPAQKQHIAILQKDGKVTSSSSLQYDSNSNTVSMDRIDVREFSGNYLDFNGASLENVALINPTMENIQHLNIESLGIFNLATGVGGGTRFVVINEKGNITTAPATRWDGELHEVQVAALSSFSSRRPLEIRSNLDMKSNIIYNANFAPRTILSELMFTNGTIDDCILQNVIANNMTVHGLGVDNVELQGLAGDTGNMLVLGESGKIQSFEKIKHINDSIVISETVNFQSSIDFNQNEVANINIISGDINGANITVIVDSIQTREIILNARQTHDHNVPSSSHLAIITEDGGYIRRSPLTMTSTGEFNDVRIVGTLYFGYINNSETKTGRIKHAIIEDSDIVKARSLGVIGKASFEEEVNIEGELYVNKGITVNGPVLGAGPYIDASDARFKKNINQLSGETMLEKLKALRGVSYDFLPVFGSPWHSRKQVNRTQIGFIAQEVEAVFPELVDTSNEGFKGIQYSRFVPILVESIKELRKEMKMLSTEVHMLRDENNELRNGCKM